MDVREIVAGREPSHLIDFRILKILGKCCFWDEHRVIFQFLDAAVSMGDCAT